MNKALFVTVLIAFAAAADFTITGKFKALSQFTNDFGEIADLEFHKDTVYNFESISSDKLGALPYKFATADIGVTNSKVKDGEQLLVFTATAPDTTSNKPTVKLLLAYWKCSEITGADVNTYCKAENGCQKDTAGTGCENLVTKACDDPDRNDKAKCESDKTCVYEDSTCKTLALGNDTCGRYAKDYICGAENYCIWSTTCKHRQCKGIAEAKCENDDLCTWDETDPANKKCKLTVPCTGKNQRECTSLSGDCTWTGTAAAGSCAAATRRSTSVARENRTNERAKYDFYLSCVFNEATDTKVVTLACTENVSTGARTITFEKINGAVSVFASFALLAVALLFALF